MFAYVLNNLLAYSCIHDVRTVYTRILMRINYVADKCKQAWREEEDDRYQR